jgi:hypothetical protein
MCSKHHGEWEEHRGYFAGWSKDQRREFMDWEIENENAAFERGEELICPF